MKIFTNNVVILSLVLVISIISPLIANAEQKYGPCSQIDRIILVSDANQSFARVRFQGNQTPKLFQIKYTGSDHSSKAAQIIDLVTKCTSITFVYNAAAANQEPVTAETIAINLKD